MRGGDKPGTGCGRPHHVLRRHDRAHADVDVGGEPGSQTTEGIQRTRSGQSQLQAPDSEVMSVAVLQVVSRRLRQAP